MKPTRSTPTEKLAFWTANGLLLLVALVLASMTMLSCNSFKRAQQKFATTTIDSVTTPVSVTVAVPADSVTATIPTALTPLVKTFRHGRVHGTITRTATETTVDCQCDSLSIAKKAVAQFKFNRETWGVSPRYKTEAESWRLSTIVLACLLFACILVYLFLYHLKINIARR